MRARIWTEPFFNGEADLFIARDGAEGPEHAVLQDDGSVVWHPHLEGGKCQPFVRIMPKRSFVDGTPTFVPNREFAPRTQEFLYT